MGSWVLARFLPQAKFLKGGLKLSYICTKASREEVSMAGSGSEYRTGRSYKAPKGLNVSRALGATVVQSKEIGRASFQLKESSSK